MAHSFRKRMLWLQAGLMLAAAVLGFSVMGGSVTSAAQTDVTVTPTPIGGGSGQIAFTSDRDGNFEIYVIDADGSNARRLTNNPQADFDPNWSPNGEQIAFTSERDGTGEIYVMNADGTNLHRLTNYPDHDIEPTR